MAEVREGELQTVDQPPTNQMKHQQTNELLGEGGHLEMIVRVAKQYGRDLKKVLKEVEEEIHNDEALLASCWYMKPVGWETVNGKRQRLYAEGPSIRFAEVAMSAYGNLQTCVWQDNHTGTQVIAHARVWDMEKNIYHEEEVRGSIITKDGKRYAPEGIVNAGLAAQSKALRNAVTRVIGKGKLISMRNRLEQAARARLGVGKQESIGDTIRKSVEAYAGYGIDEACLCFILGIDEISDMTADDIIRARRIYTAIKDGDQNPHEFIADFAKAIGAQRDVADSIDDPSDADSEPSTPATESAF